MTVRKKLYNQIHAEKKRLIFEELGARCVICDSTHVVQLGHVIPAGSSLNLRFADINLFPQCRICNGIHRYNQAPYINWYVQKFGADALDDLTRKSREVKQYKISDLREILKQLKETKSYLED